VRAPKNLERRPGWGSKTMSGGRGASSATLDGDDQVPPKLKFEITSSLGKRIRVSDEYWQKIIETKHPVMAGQDELVKQTLASPEQVRRSRKDVAVHLHYRKNNGRYCCVVAKHLNGDGFVVMAYLTDTIKAGEVIA